MVCTSRENYEVSSCGTPDLKGLRVNIPQKLRDKNSVGCTLFFQQEQTHDDGCQMRRFTQKMFCCVVLLDIHWFGHAQQRVTRLVFATIFGSREQSGGGILGVGWTQRTDFSNCRCPFPWNCHINSNKKGSSLSVTKAQHKQKQQQVPEGKHERYPMLHSTPKRHRLWP